MTTTRVDMRTYEDMDALYAAMPDDFSRSAVVHVWRLATYGYNVDDHNAAIRVLAGIWGELVDRITPRTHLLDRWEQDHGLRSR